MIAEILSLVYHYFSAFPLLNNSKLLNVTEYYPLWYWSFSFARRNLYAFQMSAQLHITHFWEKSKVKERQHAVNSGHNILQCQKTGLGNCKAKIETFCLHGNDHLSLKLLFRKNLAIAAKLRDISVLLTAFSTFPSASLS